MAFRIKFSAGTAHKSERTIPRRSVVQVYFAANHRSLAYYNDRFDLKPGDLVFVDGKLAGQRGRVTQVNYSFKIRLSDYKRVISVADIAVDGLFYAAGSHLVTFDRGVLPACQAAGWFLPPADPEEEFASGADNEAFSLDELWASDAMFQRGYDYYKRGLVRYISLDGRAGYALVEGTAPYEVEFAWENGEISRLVCSCFCSGCCKHQAAVMLQLQDLLGRIEGQYPDAYARSGYFAAVYRQTLFEYAVDSRENGPFPP